jgi:YkoY family integral membrane protein
MDLQLEDLITVALLVLLEGLLSADNALVLAILVLGLPRKQQLQALRYGIIGAFGFRILATLLAVHLIAVSWVKLVGAGYLLYLSWKHFLGEAGMQERRAIKPALPWLGMSAFWATVVKVELTDIVFAVDSILVAVAMSNKTSVIITGGILGIITMRMVIGQLLTIVRRYPAIVDGAFIIIAWVGIKLLIEYLHAAGYIHFEVNKWVSFGMIAVIFLVSYIYARAQGPQPDEEAITDEAAELFQK